MSNPSTPSASFQDHHTLFPDETHPPRSNTNDFDSATEDGVDSIADPTPVSEFIYLVVVLLLIRVSQTVLYELDSFQTGIVAHYDTVASAGL